MCRTSGSFNECTIRSHAPSTAPSLLSKQTPRGPPPPARIHKGHGGWAGELRPSRRRRRTFDSRRRPSWTLRNDCRRGFRSVKRVHRRCMSDRRGGAILQVGLHPPQQTLAHPSTPSQHLPSYHLNTSHHNLSTHLVGTSMIHPSTPFDITTRSTHLLHLLTPPINSRYPHVYCIY